MFDSRISKEDVLPLVPRAAALPAEVGERLQWFLHFTEHRSVRGTCRHFGIARTTFYRWARRFDPANLSALMDLPTTPQPPGLAPAPTAALGARLESKQPESPDAARHSLAHCFFCRMRGQWRGISRGLLILSVVANVFFIAAFLAITWMEGRNAATSTLSGQVIPAAASAAFPQ